MNLYISPLANRVAITKMIGLLFGGVGFFLLPVFFNETDIFLRFGVLFWYVTLGAIIGIFGVLDTLPVLKISFPFYLRGPWIGGWMNFVLVLFIHDKFVFLTQGTAFAGFSPFWLILEGCIFGFIADYFATKLAGDGKKLLSK